jgi:hypothetical protein
VIQEQDLSIRDLVHIQTNYWKNGGSWQTEGWNWRIQLTIIEIKEVTQIREKRWQNESDKFLPTIL